MLTVIPARSDGEHYVLEERLGRGGVAETWRARLAGGLVVREVCIKRPLRALGDDALRGLLEEARLLSRVRHANVVSLLDVVPDGQRPCLVLELVRGADLKVLSRALALANESLPAPVVAAIGVQLCRALAAAQRAIAGGLVHRDVTPHNVLVSREGEVKLADFGIARAFDRERWTAPGLIKGKRAYVSPELLDGGELDVRSDLFALGIVLFELLSGRRPFGGPGGSGALAAIAAGRPGPLFAPHAPAGLRDVVERFLSYDRSERPPTADAAARLLAGYADEQQSAEVLRRLVTFSLRPGLARSRPLERHDGFVSARD